jgi:hypothetical protein
MSYIQVGGVIQPLVDPGRRRVHCTVRAAQETEAGNVLLELTHRYGPEPNQFWIFNASIRKRKARKAHAEVGHKVTAIVMASGYVTDVQKALRVGSFASRHDLVTPAGDRVEQDTRSASGGKSHI